MTDNIFNKSSIAPAKEVAVDTEPKIVESETGGQDVQLETPADEKTFSGKEVEKIVQDRLARERKKFEKEKTELQSKAPKPVPSNLEEDYRAKLAEYESQVKTRDEKISKFRNKTLSKTLESALQSAGCIDAEIVAKDLISSNRVTIDDDTGEVIAETLTGSPKVEDLIAEFTSRKPHLFKSQSKGGIGSQGPKTPGTSTDRMSEIKAQLNINTTKNKKLFG